MTYHTPRIKEEPSTPPSLPDMGEELQEMRPAQNYLGYVPTPGRASLMGTGQTYQNMGPMMKSENAKPPSDRKTKLLLKNAVLTRRRATGQSEITVNFEEPKQCQLTKADLDRRERRKAQNRTAAKRCRNKKREQQMLAEKTTEEYVSHNEALSREVLLLKKQIDELVQLLTQHVQSGTCKFPSDLQRVLCLPQISCYDSQGGQCVQHGLQQVHISPFAYLVPPPLPDSEAAACVTIENNCDNEKHSSDLKIIEPSVDAIMVDGNTNLPSWDLSKILPDLPLNNGMESYMNLSQYCTPHDDDDANLSSHAEPTAQVVAASQGKVGSSRALNKPPHVRNLASQFTNISPTSKFAETVPDCAQGLTVFTKDPAITADLASALHVPTTPYFCPDNCLLSPDALACVSPNQIQQISFPERNFHPSSTDSSTCYNSNLNFQPRVNPNITTNDVFEMETFPPGIDVFSDCHTDQSLNSMALGCQTAQLSSHDNIFNFDPRACLESLTLQGQDPISPFLTTGFNRASPPNM